MLDTNFIFELWRITNAQLRIVNIWWVLLSSLSAVRELDLEKSTRLPEKNTKISAGQNPLTYSSGQELVTVPYKTSSFQQSWDAAQNSDSHADELHKSFNFLFINECNKHFTIETSLESILTAESKVC